MRNDATALHSIVFVNEKFSLHSRLYQKLNQSLYQRDVLITFTEIDPTQYLVSYSSCIKHYYQNYNYQAVNYKKKII